MMSSAKNVDRSSANMSANQGPNPRCNSHTRRRALILVDLSVEQMSAVERLGADAIVANLIRLVTAPEEDASSTKESQNSATGIFHLGIDCRLWLKSPQESSLSKVWPEAGRTLFVAESDGASLIPELGAIIQSSSRHDNPTAGIPYTMDSCPQKQLQLLCQYPIAPHFAKT